MSSFLVTYDLREAKSEIYAKIDNFIKTTYTDCMKFSNTTWLLFSTESTGQLYKRLDEHVPTLFTALDKLIVVKFNEWSHWTPEDKVRDWIKEHSS